MLQLLSKVVSSNRRRLLSCTEQLGTSADGDRDCITYNLEETGDNDDGGVDGDDDDADDADATDDEGNDGECVRAAQDDLEEKDSVGDRLRSSVYARVPVEILSESWFAVEPLLIKYCKEHVWGAERKDIIRRSFRGT